MRRLRTRETARRQAPRRHGDLWELLDAAGPHLHFLRPRPPRIAWPRRSALQHLLPAAAPAPPGLWQVRAHPARRGQGHRRQPGPLLQLQRPASACPLLNLREDQAWPQPRRPRFCLQILPPAPRRTLLRLRPAPASSSPLAHRPGLSWLLRAHPEPSRRLPEMRHGTASDCPRRRWHPGLRALHRNPGRLPVPRLRNQRTPLRRGPLPPVPAAAAPPASSGGPRRPGPRAARTRPPRPRRGQEPARGAVVAQAEPER